MSKINIDEIVEPIEVIVGGKSYILDDIPRETMKEMMGLGRKSDELEEAIKDVEILMAEAKSTNDVEGITKTKKTLMNLLKREDEEDSISQLATIMAKVLKADKADIKKLGMRKLTMLIKKVMGTLNEELDQKNVPKVAVAK